MLRISRDKQKHKNTKINFILVYYQVYQNMEINEKEVWG